MRNSLLWGLGVLGLFFSAPARADDMATRYAGFLQAQVALLAGDDRAALEGYLQTIGYDDGSLQPDEVVRRSQTLQLALLAGDIDSAVQLAKTLPESPPEPTMVWLVRLVEAARNGDVEAAITWASRLQARTPLLQFDLMRAYAERARHVAVASVIKQLGPLPKDPAQQARFWYHVARMTAQIGDYKAAEQAATQAAGLEPHALFSTMLLAELYYASGKADAADALLETYRKANPSLALLGLNEGQMATPALGTGLADDLASVLFDFGVIVWAQGAETPARQMMNMALWLDPEGVYIKYYSGIIEEFGGYLEVARGRFEVLADDPRVGLAARLRMAEIDFKLGRIKEATRQLDALLREYGDEPSLLRARANMAFESEDYRKAHSLLKRVWATLPESEEGHPLRAQIAFMLGACAERLKRYGDAAEWLQRSLEEVPQSPAVLNYLGYMWVERNENLDKAFELLKTALMLAPEDGAITDSVGWAYYMRGNYEAAESYVERAAELEPDDAVVIDHLGDIYAARGRTEEAIWQWRRALEMVRGDDSEEELQRSLERKLR